MGAARSVFVRNETLKSSFVPRRWPWAVCLSPTLLEALLASNTSNDASPFAKSALAPRQRGRRLGNNEASNQSAFNGEDNEPRRGEEVRRPFGASAQTAAVAFMLLFKGNEEPLEEPLGEPGLMFCSKTRFKKHLAEGTLTVPQLRGVGGWLAVWCWVCAATLTSAYKRYHQC